MDLTKPEQMLLWATEIAISGEHTDSLHAIETNSDLMQHAQIHKLLPLVVDAVYSQPSAIDWPEFPLYQRNTRIQVLQQAQRSKEFLDAYAKLQEGGILPLVVKGCVCRAVWPKGDLRQSADEDLLVRDEDFSRACAVLRELGLVCDESADPKKDFEIGWRRPNSTLYIELHRRLFAPDSALGAELEALFDGAFDRAQEYEVEHGAAKVRSMSPEDHLLYLILHAYKHFIYSGFGIRQVCDVGLWAKRYAAEIDHPRLMKQLDQVHALYFAAAVFAIAREDLGIDLHLQECWNGIQVDREPMLRDLLDAGIYGGSTMSRQHSAPMTVEAGRAARSGQQQEGLLRRIFPRREALERQYPELREHPGQLPLVWGRRLAKYRREIRSDTNNSPAESLRIARERLTLLKLYGILPDRTGKR